MGAVLQPILPSLIEHWSSNLLAPVSGDLSLPCLEHKATIKYDKWGVPHIYTETDKDAYRVNGFLAAQHRSFQLTQVQLVAQGRISELVGEAGKSIDVFSRTIGFYRLATNDWEYLQEQSKNYESKSNGNSKDEDDNINDHQYCIDMVNSYVEGVNAWFGHPKCKYSVELTKLLKFTPEFWTPIDVMATWRILGLKMSFGWQNKLMKALIIQCVGYENAQWLTLDSHELAPRHCPYNDDKVKLTNTLNENIKEKNPENSGNFDKNINQFYQSLMNLGSIPNDQPNTLDKNGNVIGDSIGIEVENAIGSNAWVVSGEYTNTGKPLLAGDPHLKLQSPNLFMYIHIKSKENLHLSGLHTPGLPGIVIGHTQHVGWSITLGVSDIVDLFVERFENEGSTKYQIDGKWEEASILHEIIKMKGCDKPYEFDVAITKHGPVLQPTDYERGGENGPYDYVNPDTPNYDECSKEATLGDNGKYDLRYAFASPMVEEHTNGLWLLPKLLKTKNLLEMRGNVRKIAYPPLNFVGCDTSENYGWMVSGKIPIRGFKATHNGKLPIPGWLSKYDWQGYIPEDELPCNINCNKGYVVSCNHPQVDQRYYPYYLGSIYAVGYRAWRACDLIETKIIEQQQNNNDDEKSTNTSKIDVKYMESMQLDCTSYFAKEFMSLLYKMKDNEFESLLNDTNKESMFNNDTIFMKINNQMNFQSVRKNNSASGKYEYWSEENKKKAQYCWNTLINGKEKWDFRLNTESQAAAIWSSLMYCLVRNILFTGVYNGFLKQEQAKQAADNTSEEKDEKSNMPDKERDIESKVTALAENIICKVYNPAYCGATPFFFHAFFIVMKIFEQECNEITKYDNSKQFDVTKNPCFWLSNYDNINILLYISLIDGYDMLTYWLKSDNDKSQQWTYGKLHRFEVFHPFSIKLGSKPFNRGPFPMNGGMHTLCMIRPKFTAPELDPFNCIQAGVPVWRQILDPSDWDESKCVLPMGTSGQLASPYYDNMLELWRKGEYIPMLWSDENVEKNKESQVNVDPSLPLNSGGGDQCNIL